MNHKKEIKKLKKKLKKCKKKNKQVLKELIICQEKRSGHWDKLVYEKTRNEKLEKTLSSTPYIALKYTLLPLVFLKKKAIGQFKKRNAKKNIADHASPRGAVKHIKDIKVALICDEFSYNSFKYEFDAVVLEPDNWKEKLIAEKPDFFFCESAWSGIDPKRRPWQGKIYSSINFKHENRTELLNILKYCHEHNIPTVFWNKEDPTHFDDRVHDFVKTATNFDYIFTTDEECVQKYKNEYGCQKVFCLPFATQPRLFNPIENYPRSDKIIFAGSWYENHIERSKAMINIFDNILKNNKEIEIYDRYYYDDDELHIFPEQYHSFIKPPVSHNHIDKIYKSSLFGLNINTVTESSTMFARRVYELMSSHTFIISNYSKGVEKLLQKNIVFADRDTNKLSKLSNQEIDQIRDENLHLALEKHTYYERFKTLLDTIGIPFIPIDRSVTIVCIAIDESEISKIISFYRMQELDNKRLLIVLSTNIPDIQIAALITKYNKSDVGVIAYSYLQLKKKNWDSIIETQYIALMDFTIETRNDLVKRALLHTNYTDKTIIMKSKEKYITSNKAYSTNILSHKNNFGTLLKNMALKDKVLEGKALESNDKKQMDSFYHV